MVTLDGAPWFVLADVCRTLSLSNASEVSRSRVEPAEKGQFKLPNQRGSAATIITKTALYKLVMESRKPSALEFKDWIAEVVLPAIEKDGGYVLGEEKVVTGEPLPESHESIDESPQSVLGRCSMPCRRTPRQTAYFLFKSIAYCTFPG